jgi:UDPglucose 6-dehydrogenase
MREAPSVVIIENLIKKGAKIKVYDPRAMTVAKEFYFKDENTVKFQKEAYGATEDIDALVLVTEWKEFRSPDFELMLTKMKQKIIFDGRNQYNKYILEKLGFEYYQIGTN